MLPGRLKLSMVFTRLAMKSSAINCQPALIDKKTVCKTCCSVKFNSLPFDGSLTVMNSIFEEMFGESFWKQAVMVFTRLAMKSSAINCQPALIGKKAVCNTCCSVKFNSLRFDGSLTCMNNIFEELFGESFWKQTMMAFTGIAMKSSAINCQRALIDKKTVCNTCWPVKFNSLRFDGSLTGMNNIFEEMFGESFWKQTMMAFTRIAMKSSAINCQPALIDKKPVCNTCCPVKFNSFRMDGKLTSMNNIFEEMFGEAFWKQTVMVFTRLAMKSSTIHCQPALIDNKIVCNTCFSVKLNSLLFDGSLPGMNNIFEEMFGEAFWKQTVMVFARLSMKSSSTHCQLLLNVN